MTKAALAKVLDLTQRQIENLAAEGMPREKVDGVWMFGTEAITWYIKKVKGRTREASDYEKARARREQALADMAIAERDQKLGALIPVTEYEEEYTAAIARVDAKLKGLAHRVVAVVEGMARAEALKRISPVVEQIRKELYESSDEAEDDERASAAGTRRPARGA